MNPPGGRWRGDLVVFAAEPAAHAQAARFRADSRQYAQVQYAGAAPGYVSGLLQVNVQVPTTINFGNLIPLSLMVGSYTSQLQVSIARSEKSFHLRDAETQSKTKAKREKSESAEEAEKDGGRGGGPGDFGGGETNTSSQRSEVV